MIQRLQPPDNSVHPKSVAEWRRWLARNHERTAGVWLVTFKKATGKARMTYDEAVEEALCWGWIDSTTRALDDERGMLWMAPRKPRSGWSKSNKERVARLAKEGRLAPPGKAKIAAAKRDGSWTALDAVEAMVVPDDLAGALRAHAATANFDAFAPSSAQGDPRLDRVGQARRDPRQARRGDRATRGDEHPAAAMDSQMTRKEAPC